MNLQVFLAGTYFGGVLTLLLQSVLIDRGSYYIGMHGRVEGWRHFALQVLGAIVWPLSLISAYLQASRKREEDDFDYGLDADAALGLKRPHDPKDDDLPDFGVFVAEVSEALEAIRRIEAAVCPDEALDEAAERARETEKFKKGGES